jgi:peptidyl-tRNA hydrolase
MASRSSSAAIPAALLEPLIEMGIPADRAAVGLQRTGCVSVDAALSWICDHPEDEHYVAQPTAAPAALASAASAVAASQRQPPQLESDGDDDGSDDDDDDDSDDDGEESCKMVLCVRQDLKMRGGKIAAQCVHAALGAYRDAQERNPEFLRRWERRGEAVVCVKIDSEAQMTALQVSAETAVLPNYIVADAGRTQVAAGSQTVLAIGPGPISLLDSLTGALKLL